MILHSHPGYFLLVALATVLAACGGGDGDTFGTGAGAGGGGGGTGGTTVASGSGTASGSSSTGGASSSSTGTGGTTSGTGGGSNGCPGNSPGALFWTTLDDAASVTQPKLGVGAGAGLQTTPADDFTPALSGNGIVIDQPNEWVRFRETGGNMPNIELDRGTIDFCYRPSYAHTDNLNHHLFGTARWGGTGGGIRARKAASNNANAFHFLLMDGQGKFAETNVAVANYALSPGTWVRITITWDTAATTQHARVYFDGGEATAQSMAMGPLTMRAEDPNEYFYIGAWTDMDPEIASGTIDEFKVYPAPIAP